MICCWIYVFFSYSEKHKNKMKYSSFVASKYTFVQAKLVIAQYSDEDCMDRCRASSGVLGKCQIISRVADSNLNFVKLSNLQSAIKPKAATAAWVSWSQPICKENKLELTIQFTSLISKWFFSLAAWLHQRTRVHSYLPNPILTHAINPFLTDSIWPQSNHFLKTTIGLINKTKKRSFLYGIILVYYIFVPPCCTKQPVHWKRLSLLLATTTK